MAVYLTLLVVISGGLEMFYYIPTVKEAALSIQTITYLVPLGNLTRNLHYWSSLGILAEIYLSVSLLVSTGCET